jgi:hypothetical protein
MSNLRAHRSWLGRLAIIGCLASLPAATAAHADGANILGGFLNALGSAVVLGSWQKVDPQTQNCLANQFNMNPSDLAQQGVLATDPRVTPYIAQCQQLIQQAQEQQTQQSQQASIEQQRSPEDEAQRRADLTARFGKRDTDLIMQGQIGIGMKHEEVVLAWGDPSAKTTQGKSREVWNYGQDGVVFVHGIVSAVTH